MVLKLHGFHLSPATRRVLLVLKECNVPFEFISVDLRKGEHKSPEYLTKHPFGVVPLIDDDGFKLFESRAICRYIVAKYGSQTKLVPTDLQAHALFEQAASIELSYFDSPATVILLEKIIKKFMGKESDEARYEEALKKLESALDIYEELLSKQKYLAGDEVTLVDLFHLPLGNAVESVAKDTLEKRPHVAKWWNSLSTRPSWVPIKEGTAIPAPEAAPKHDDSNVV